MKRLFLPVVLTMIGSVLLPLESRGDDPCRSGPQPGRRPGPYSALVVVGPQRGTQHCYICEAEDRPVVIVFARTLSEPLGKLVHGLDRKLNDHRKEELRSWVTILAADQTALDPRVVAWSKDHATGSVPLAVFEDPVGPPAYLLSRDADVTVLLAIRQKVVANHAFRKGELNDAAVRSILDGIPRMISGKK